MIRLLLLLALGLAAAPPAHAQPDTTATAEVGIERLPRSPRGAVWRAVAVPGWGQIYNRHYYKLPLVYLALGGITYNAVRLHDDYQLYRQAYQYKAFQELVESGQLAENPHTDFADAYRTLTDQFGFEISSSPLRAQRDNLRRNRDLSFLGIGLVYALSALDAFVSAHLADFDVGEDLTVTLQPRPDLGGLTATVRLGL